MTPDLDQARIAAHIAVDEFFDAMRAALAPTVAPLTADVDEAARLLGCSASHVRKLVAAGRLPKVPDMGDRVLIPIAALRAHAEVDTSVRNHPSAHGLRLVEGDRP
jgi:excisionase family DNA binding protein